MRLFVIKVIAFSVVFTLVITNKTSERVQYRNNIRKIDIYSKINLFCKMFNVNVDQYKRLLNRESSGMSNAIAYTHNIDPSNYARGIAQVRPSTMHFVKDQYYTGFNSDLFDAENNIMVSLSYLYYLKSLFLKYDSRFHKINGVLPSDYCKYVAYYMGPQFVIDYVNKNNAIPRIDYSDYICFGNKVSLIITENSKEVEENYDN